MKATSQNQAILNHLILHQGLWVSMPELVKVSGSYNIHSRTAELRKKGHIIENKVVRQDDGKNHSYYRIP